MFRPEELDQISRKIETRLVKKIIDEAINDELDNRVRGEVNKQLTDRFRQLGRVNTAILSKDI